MKNKVSWLLAAIVFAGMVYSVGYQFDWWPTHTTENWNGTKGFRAHWDIWLNMHYGFVVLLLISNFIEKTRTDYNVLVSFTLFDVFGWLSYNYSGWPEPFNLFVSGFCLSSVLLIILEKWKN